MLIKRRSGDVPWGDADAQKSKQPPLADGSQESCAATYLHSYKYVAANARSWQVRPGPKGSGPQLTIALNRHEEMQGHTTYILECSLVLCGCLNVQWEAPRRLVHLRQGLHGPFKQRLGPTKYRCNFAGAAFAHRGGLPGTTTKLQRWLFALTSCINYGMCSPGDTAFVLHFLDTPPAFHEQRSIKTKTGAEAVAALPAPPAPQRPRRPQGSSSSSSSSKGHLQLPQEGKADLDEAAVRRLVCLGFAVEKAWEAYVACDQKENAAANLLLETAPTETSERCVVVQEQSSAHLRRAAAGNAGLSEGDHAAVRRLCDLGFAQQQALQAYLACDRDQELAIQLLLESSMD